uniref:Helitron helicase-like domain-containing protein n=1 Tax=Anopheles arabiensis TaxID=7173 RepID=A0A182HPH8_ANOAR
MFLKSIRKFNSCFQMTSFGATEIVSNASSNGQIFNSTFKIKGQVYHKVGSLLPMPNTTPKFLQIYFMGGDDNNRVDTRCSFTNLSSISARRIVYELDALLNEHNVLLNSFKSHMHELTSDNYAIVINPDKTPSGEHVRRFNAPVMNDVAEIVVGDRTSTREIVIRRRNNNLEFISDIHRSYDALQYPLIFWKGQDGYCINIKQRDPITGNETNKKVSSMDFYSYRLMVRRNEDNLILRCRELFQQFIVDMYAKVENERLRYLRHNQKKLRAEEYIHLRDAIMSDVNSADIGNNVILPSSYVGSPRHMQEYIQDAMTFVREYGRPCLFITFTCNPKWEEITCLLLPGQNATHRHDITARVFKQKLKSLMNLITKMDVFGSTRCWMYSVEWQKRGLPHAHILIWLVDKIRPEDIDSLISAEIPDPSRDQLLFDIVTTNMIHGPCGALNSLSPCMAEGKCTKRFPKQFTNETITNVDGYPIYRTRNTENGGHSYTHKNNQDSFIDIDNRWVVPYSPLLTKTFNAHINVEFCSSVKSIKYICKYINKGSDMAVFNIQNTEVNTAGSITNDEITGYQIGRYISSNEAVWRIFGFQIHERYPAVVHLAVHLENGQRVFFLRKMQLNVLQIHREQH